MRHDRPTFPNDLPPPWAVMLPDARMETLSDASKRLSVRADRLRERALDLGYWDGVVREGQTITQRADAWDRVASYHRKPGPKRDLHDRRAIKARESASGASMRLRVSGGELRSRAQSATGSRAARAPAEWDALALGMERV